MLKINKLTQLSTTSTRSKTKHKDGNEPLHKIHAYYRDPTGQRNADKNDRPPNKIWFKHVEDSEEFIKASIRKIYWTPMGIARKIDILKIP